MGREGHLDEAAMTDLRPYERPRVPLSAGARFIRGFRRVGAALAIITIIIGGIATVATAVSFYNSDQGRYDQAVCIVTMYGQKKNFVMNEYRKDEIDMDASGCFGPGYTETFAAIWQRAQHKPTFASAAAMEPLFIGAAVTIGIAALLYVICWAVGWIFAGFTRD